MTTGGLFPLKGLPMDMTRRRMTVLLHEQRASVSPFGAPDQRTRFTADHGFHRYRRGKLLAFFSDDAAS